MKTLRTPAVVDIEISRRCNLQCQYCSYFTSPADVERELSLEKWRRIFRELGRCAVMQIVLQGGEPFCRNDLLALVREIAANRIRFQILSNGTLIDDEWARLLADVGRCDGVQVSIDGSRAQVHDAFRGRGSFHRAVAGIRCLMRHHVPVQVRVTLHKRNINDLAGIARFLLENLGLPGFSTNSAAFLGRCRQHSEEIQLDVEDHTFAMAELLRLQKHYNGRIYATAGPLADAANWVAMDRARAAGADPPPGGGFLSACNAAASKISIRADGEMVPCLHLGHLELGNIQNEDLDTVWRMSPVLHELRNRSRISLRQFSFCRDCPWLDYCSGNCPAVAYTLMGSTCHPSPDGCLRRFVESGGRLPSPDLIS